MKTKNKVAMGVAAGLIAVGMILLAPNTAAVQQTVATSTPERVLTHAQETWMRALEWCESHGVPKAINEIDLDGTPSFGSWQFKPSTLDYYAEMYGVATTTVMDRAVQEKVLRQMLLHYDDINWRNQFPGCINTKIGMPPK